MVTLTTFRTIAKIVKFLYHQIRDAKELRAESNTALSRADYFRIFALASIDIVLTLPINISTLALSLSLALDVGPIPFYPGWTFSHSSWAPISTSYTELQSDTPDLVLFYFTGWISPVLGFVIFGLFGLTAEARALYWSFLRTGVTRLGQVPNLWMSHNRLSA